MSRAVQRREGQALATPNSDGNIWPGQSCPAFTPRIGTAEKACWYCVHVDFHLDKPCALDVGVCYWPKKILK
jgi:hypothetical protein